MTINDRVRDCWTREAGTIVGIRNGMYMVQMDNGDEKIYTDAEVVPDCGMDWGEVGQAAYVDQLQNTSVTIPESRD